LPSKIDGKILEAAERVFSEHGYYGTTTKEIAVAADVTEGSIFRLFKSKENLFAEVLNRSASRQMPVKEFRALLEREGSFEENVQNAVRRWYTTAELSYVRLACFTLLFSPKLTKEILNPRGKELVRALATAIDRHRGRRPVSKTAIVTAQQLMYGLVLKRLMSSLGVKHVELTEREFVSQVVHNTLCSIEQDAA
jgi:AcrR family transcriptional regulator